MQNCIAKKNHSKKANAYAQICILFGNNARKPNFERLRRKTIWILAKEFVSTKESFESDLWRPSVLSNDHYLRGIGPIHFWYFHFLLCDVKSSTLSNERNFFWGTPIWRQSANKTKMAQIRPKGRSRAPDGRAPNFFRSFDRVDDLTSHIKKNENDRTNSSQVMAILRFFRPGHPSPIPRRTLSVAAGKNVFRGVHGIYSSVALDTNSIRNRFGWAKCPTGPTPSLVTHLSNNRTFCPFSSSIKIIRNFDFWKLIIIWILSHYVIVRVAPCSQTVFDFRNFGVFMKIFARNPVMVTRIDSLYQS